MQSQIVNYLIAQSNNELLNHNTSFAFTDNAKWNKLFNDIDNFSHLFLLACIGDKRIQVQRAWSIPMIIGEVNGYDFSKFLSLTASDYNELFNSRKLHLHNNSVSLDYFEAVQNISKEYDGLAKNVWEKDLRSEAIIRKMLEFKGVGQKIASMTVNLLYRHFKLPIKNIHRIDVSPDTHIQRLFKRTGLARLSATNEQIIWRARELHDDYPGMIDIGFYNLGRTVCSAKKPVCSQCPIERFCPKLI